MLKLLVATSLLLGAAPVAAQTQPAAPPPAKAQKSESNRVICQTEQQIGSRLAAKRVCMTAEEWKAREQQIRSQLDQSHIGTQSTPGPG